MPQTFARPPIPRPPDAPPVELLPGRLTWTSELGFVKLVLDTKNFDFHMDVEPGALAPVVAAAITQLHFLGFEPLDEDECEPELLRNGGTRIYLVPIVPLDDAPLIPAQCGPA